MNVGTTGKVFATVLALIFAGFGVHNTNNVLLAIGAALIVAVGATVILERLGRPKKPALEPPPPPPADPLAPVKQQVVFDLTRMERTGMGGNRIRPPFESDRYRACEELVKEGVLVRESGGVYRLKHG